MKTDTASPNYTRVVPKSQVKALKRRLRELGLTYLQVAREAGVTYSMVRQVANGYKKSSNVMGAVARLEALALQRGQRDAGERLQGRNL